jgi:hypothetical protein
MMAKKKFKKHPAKMTSDELAEGVFHPKVLEAATERSATAKLPKRTPKSSK